MGMLSQLRQQLLSLRQLRALTQQQAQTPAQLAPPAHLQGFHRPRMSW